MRLSLLIIGLTIATMWLILGSLFGTMPLAFGIRCKFYIRCFVDFATVVEFLQYHTMCIIECIAPVKTIEFLVGR
jgi:hypothetical protein